MRPLVVLLLVLASLAALLFALTTMTGSRGTEEGRGLAVAPTRPTAGRTDLIPAQPVTETVSAARPVVDETRQAVQPDLRVDGRRVQFGAIEGVVLTADGEPIAEAEVALLNTRPSALGDDIYALRGIDPPKPVVKTKTKADGLFRFEQLDPRKDWSLTVAHRSYVGFRTELAIPVPEGGTWKETVILEPGLVSQGKVLDARTNLPIEGALLVVDGPFARMNAKKSPGRLEAVTDAEGAYSFTNVGKASQPRVLTISAPGYATQVHTNFLLVAQVEAPIRFKNVRGRAGPEGQDHDFALEPGKIIAGRVIDPSRRGVAGVEVEAISQSGTLISQGVTRSSEKGEFLVEGLADGIYTLRVTATNFDAHPVQRVEAGRTDIVIELFEQGAAAGKVVDSRGQPLSTFVVKARSDNDVNPGFGSVVAQRSVKGSKDGSFQINGLPEGGYVIEATAQGYASSFSDAFTATQGLVTGDVIVRMTQGGSISGIVLESYTGAPIIGAEINTVDNDWIDGELWELFGAMEDPTASTKTKVFTDAEGRFEVTRMTPGLYQVQVKARGYTPFSVKDVVVVEGQNTEVPSHLLIKGAVVRGTVFGPDKSPQAGAAVQISPSDQSFEGQRTVRSDASGRFVLENVRPGTYDISATRPSSGSGNPFEAIADMQQTKIQVSVEDGNQYDFDLQFSSQRK